MTTPNGEAPVVDLMRERLGIELVNASAETATARMPVAGNRQPAGLLAGGASIALAESIASQAASMHAAGLGKVAVGTEVNATHHRSARRGWVHAHCASLHLGSRVATYDVTITDDDGHRLTTARVSCVLLDAPKARESESE